MWELAGSNVRIFPSSVPFFFNGGARVDLKEWISEFWNALHRCLACTVVSLLDFDVRACGFKLTDLPLKRPFFFNGGARVDLKEWISEFWKSLHRCLACTVGCVQGFDVRDSEIKSWLEQLEINQACTCGSVLDYGKWSRYRCLACAVGSVLNHGRVIADSNPSWSTLEWG